jgi:uncharacterized membrane protein YkvA (DUF1232 family)
MKKEHDPIFTEEDLKEDFTEDKLRKKGLDISNYWLYKVFIKSAYRLINRPLAILTILKRVLAKVQSYASVQSFTRDAKTQLQTIVRLLSAYAKKEYTGISKINAVLSLAALLYFLSPVDIIPDILAIGLLDDLALLTWVYSNMRSEIDAFLEWEDSKKIRISIDNN